MSVLRYPTNTSATNNWGYPLYLCDCCPYGYHIDLDFVQYCESINKQPDHTGSIKRRRDRRRQRKSMEVLLGLNPPEQYYAKIPEPISPIIEIDSRLLQKRDSFDNVIDDFEKTFQGSKHKLSNNLPDVTAVSDGRQTKITPATSSSVTEHLSMKKMPHRDYEGVNEYCNSNPSAFKNIREQMVLSLERTKQLEEQMKQLPVLKEKISSLEEENNRLQKKLEKREEKQLNTKSKFDSFVEKKSYNGNGIIKLSDGPSTKDIGVTCTVLTRNVGVGNQMPSRKNASTETIHDLVFADKWFGEKLKFIGDQHDRGTTDVTVRKSSTCDKINQASVHLLQQSTQTIELLQPKKIFTSKQIQTLNQSISQKSQSILVKPSTNDFSVQTRVESYNIGVSDDTITDINCEKCNLPKISVAVGADTVEGSHIPTISLASLSFPRSKSFNLGPDKINITSKNRSIAVQYNYVPESSVKSSQYETSNISRYSQYNIKTHSRGSQHNLQFAEVSTQSEESSFNSKNRLAPAKKDVACEATQERVSSHSIGCNTTSNISDSTICVQCQSREKVERQQSKDEAEKLEEPKKEEGKKRDDSVGLSKIPRLSTPTMERRTFRRQDTYTKINTSPPSERKEIGLSGLDLTPKSSSIVGGSLDRVKETLKISDSSKDVQSHNEVNSKNASRSQSQSSITASSMTLINAAPSKSRKKAVPSKEMLGAMKVLNDSLQKQSKLPKNYRAIDIIQQEWFTISGLITANPLDVEDYLDAFEDMSSLLLHYIVNMTDASGNTSMHYAVSHGNFDVVSILLDSKVCDINKPNKAGYTSVMLVSLADVRSQTHANVVRRLFQMADVNIRAKQHGQTALMLAVSHGRLDMVKMLLEAGADINIQDDDGSTALMCAAEHGHIEIVKHFLSQPDCDSTITDVDGSTALKIAMEAEHRQIGVLLYAHERNLMVTHGHKHKKKSSSPKPPSSPLSTRHSHSALNDIKSSK